MATDLHTIIEQYRQKKARMTPEELADLKRKEQEMIAKATKEFRDHYTLPGNNLLRDLALGSPIYKEETRLDYAIRKLKHASIWFLILTVTWIFNKGLDWLIL